MENEKSKPAQVDKGMTDMAEALKKGIDSNSDPSQMKTMMDLTQAQPRPEFKMPEAAHIPTPIETLEKLIQHYKKDGVYTDAVAHLETALYKINNINQK